MRTMLHSKLQGFTLQVFCSLLMQSQAAWCSTQSLAPNSQRLTSGKSTRTGSILVSCMQYFFCFVSNRMQLGCLWSRGNTIDTFICQVPILVHIVVITARSVKPCSIALHGGVCFGAVPYRDPDCRKFCIGIS